MKKIIVVLVMFMFFLFGCTEQRDLVLPYTTGQFIGASTDLNYTLFQDGNYSGKLIAVDGNKITAIAMNDLNAIELDGGFANSVYLSDQAADGGGA